MPSDVMRSKLVSKLDDITAALNRVPVDVAALRRLAISPGGLVCNEARVKVWPYLLDVVDHFILKPGNVRDHPEFYQVVLDVKRSGKRFPPGYSTAEKTDLENKLTELILSVLCYHPELHYYQGYHDICITFLMVCGEKQSLPLIEKISTHHLRDFMDPTMDSTSHILNYLIPILNKSNPSLVEYLLQSEVGTIFALSWLITWYSYVIPVQEDIERLYDFFLSCHPLMPVYFAAQIVLDSADAILDGECEMARIHQLLLQIARKPDLPLEDLIQRASDFYIQFPPSSLADEAMQYYKDSLAVSTFCDYALVAYHEAPDVVLQRRGIIKSIVVGDESSQQNNLFYAAKVAMYAFGGTVKATVAAIGNKALQWVPNFMRY